MSDSKQCIVECRQAVNCILWCPSRPVARVHSQLSRRLVKLRQSNGVLKKPENLA